MLRSLSLILFETLKLLKSADDVIFFVPKVKVRCSLKFVFYIITVIVVVLQDMDSF